MFASPHDHNEDDLMRTRQTLSLATVAACMDVDGPCTGSSPRPGILAAATLLAAAVVAVQPADAQVMQRRAPPPSAATTIAPASGAVAMMASWDRLPGCAKRISIAALTQIYVIGCANDKDVLIHHWQQDHWEATQARGVALAAVSNLRTATINDASHTMFSGVMPVMSDGTIGGVPGEPLLQDLASGGGWLWGVRAANGDHWGGTVVRRNNALHLVDDDDGVFQDFGNVYMKRIAVGLSDGAAWTIGENGEIYRQVNQGVGWLPQPGCATSIANAGKDDVWVIGCDAPDAEGNRAIYRWTGGNWQRVAGLAKEIALQPDGRAWALTADGAVWRQK
jgi:outer membrane lipoprotein SlyB